MKYPKNIYVASVDPMHFSHLNTMRMAEILLKEKVNLVICKNDLKEKSLFSMSERKNIAQTYLGEEEIFCANSFEEIRNFLFNAEKVVRGVRESADLEYIRKLGKYYGVEDLEPKLVLISVPNKYRNISSTKIKELVRNGDLGRAKHFVSEPVLNKLEEQYR